MSTSPHGRSDGLVSDLDLLADDSPADAPAYAPTAEDAVDVHGAGDVGGAGHVGGLGDVPFDQNAPYVEAPATAYDVSPAEAEPAYVEDSYEPASLPRRPRSTVYESLPGMPGRGVVLVTAVSTGAVAGLDFALTGHLSFFFDLTFVVVCLVAAMAVRGHDLFTTGVLPPLVFAVTVATVAMTAPSTFVDSGSLSTVFLTGLTAHAGALVFGYGTALVTVAGRAAHHRRR